MGEIAMKKKLIPALCARLLMLPVLANGEVVSMTEHCQQVEEMGANLRGARADDRS